MWTGAILAGGRARRLGGRSKAAIVLQPGGTALLVRQLATLSRVVDGAVIIANEADRFESSGVRVHAAPSDRTLVVACDMPFLSEPLLARLVDVGRDVDIAIPRTARGSEPLCATYSRRCAPELRRLIDSGELMFLNLNTPDGGARAIDLDGEYHYPS